MADQPTAMGAAQAFIAQAGISGGAPRSAAVHGLPSVSVQFAATTEQGTLRGFATYIEHDEAVFQLLAFAPDARWGAYDREVRSSFSSFSELTDPGALRVQPLRLQIVTLDRSMTVRQFYRRYPSKVPVETVALLNGVTVDETVPRGTVVKRVVGGPLP